MAKDNQKKLKKEMSVKVIFQPTETTRQQELAEQYIVAMFERWAREEIENLAKEEVTNNE